MARQPGRERESCRRGRKKCWLCVGGSGSVCICSLNPDPSTQYWGKLELQFKFTLDSSVTLTGYCCRSCTQTDTFALFLSCFPPSVPVDHTHSRKHTHSDRCSLSGAKGIFSVCAELTFIPQEADTVIVGHGQRLVCGCPDIF